ncbi:hypothetical protein [Allorhizobium borbori]|uniref:hypothetical protein n=1 Tax=Allorhizobium borbori TaxID=485907 RepID=UPI00161E34F0|nr:hypothetical protein [Allorhizobium borbori]
MSHLQQLDGLHQLRSHDERLTLAQEKAGGKCHDGRETPTIPLASSFLEYEKKNWPKNCFFGGSGQAELSPTCQKLSTGRKMMEKMPAPWSFRLRG